MVAREVETRLTAINSPFFLYAKGGGGPSTKCETHSLKPALLPKRNTVEMGTTTAAAIAKRSRDRRERIRKKTIYKW